MRVGASLALDTVAMVGKRQAHGQVLSQWLKKGGEITAAILNVLVGYGIRREGQSHCGGFTTIRVHDVFTLPEIKQA